jgi:hypothetical protein
LAPRNDWLSIFFTPPGRRARIPEPQPLPQPQEAHIRERAALRAEYRQIDDTLRLNARRQAEEKAQVQARQEARRKQEEEARRAQEEADAIHRARLNESLVKRVFKSMLRRDKKTTGSGGNEVELRDASSNQSSS